MAHRGIFAAKNSNIDIRFLHSNINSEIADHNKKTGHIIKPLTLSILMPNKTYSYQHTKIGVEDHQIYGRLEVFFSFHDLVNRSSVPNEFVFANTDIKKSDLTYKDASEFLLHLHQALGASSTEPVQTQKSAALR